VRQWAGEIVVTGLVFYEVLTATVAMQWFGKHVSTIEDVFSVESVQRSYLKNKNRCGSVLTSRLETATESSSTCEDLIVIRSFIHA
jgi:hypothetical protein